MNIVFTIILAVLLIAILTTLFILMYKIQKRSQIETTTTLLDELESREFFASEIHTVNKYLSLALNKAQTKLAIIQNYTPDMPTGYSYFEIPLGLIIKIEKGVAIKLHYAHKGEDRVLNIYPINNEIKDFIHRIYEMSYIKKISLKFAQNNFTLFNSSDWQCNYVWAYDENNFTFAYVKTGAKPEFNKINLKKEFFTIDTKYKYFEAPIFGFVSQIFVYNKSFLDDLYNSLMNSLKEKITEIEKNSIYFDNYLKTIYLTNGTTSLQSVIMGKTDDILYRDNRISFTLINEQRTINFISNQEQISSLEEFITNYNLNKIAINFDHKSDKLINTTPFTKLIIDFSRDRIIYCANLNKLARFGFMFISFSDIFGARIRKSGIKNFVRIGRKNGEVVDVTCDKKEIAQYIKAQIDKIIES